MSKRPLAVAILAAGKGTRTRLSVPKVMLPLCGDPLLGYVLEAALGLAPDRIVLVLSHAKDEIVEAMGERLAGCLIVDQGKPRGTGHAVAKALEGLDAETGEPFAGDILVLYGDSPLIGPVALEALHNALYEDLETDVSAANGAPLDLAAASLLTSFDLPPTGLGRILRDQDGCFLGIREERDCSLEELEIDEVNAGFGCFRVDSLRRTLSRLATANSQGEMYLTDVFGLLVEDGEVVRPVLAPDPDELLGVNGLADLASAREIMQERIQVEHLENGVLIEDPATTIIERNVEIGSRTRILPFVVIRSGVKIGLDCEIGPFTHLRIGAVVQDRAEVGNFVEMKKSTLGAGSKAKHLTYLGDTEIGSGTNIGAGTVTANYDGKAKHQTVIGDGAFIGSGTIIVAPATIEDGAVTGAGALVTHHTTVPEGEVWVGVPAQPLRKKPHEASEARDASDVE